MNHHPDQRTRRGSRSNTDGYVLPLVIITGLILTVGAVILSARSFNGLIRATRQRQSNEAIEIAETGALLLINELNSKYPYLLTINCKVENNAISQQEQDPICKGWGDFQLSNYGSEITVCASRSRNPKNIMESLYEPISGTNGAYRLRNYEFLGDQNQGGTAIIQVQGQRFRGETDSSDMSATAIVEQEITIVPKCCDQAPYENCASTWGYGLATKGVQLQLGDVVDQDPSIPNSNANVHCIDCDPPPSDMCQPWTSAGQIIDSNCSEIGSGIISGVRSSGPLDIPEAPTWNVAEWGDPAPLQITTANNPTFRHQRDNETKHPVKGCFTENINGKKRTHCRIESINLSGTNQIDLRPEDGDIRFYIEGQQLNLSGQTLANTGGFGQFSIFGGEATKYPFNLYSCGSKQVNISGGSEIHAFIHMPCFNINLSGGSAVSPIKIVGSAISNQWNATGDFARLEVPTDAGETICNTYGVCSSNADGKEFTALGRKQWSLIQMEPE